MAFRIPAPKWVREAWRTIFTRPDWWKRVDQVSLRQDFWAGLTGATVVLPQAIAFAEIAGLPPQAGFYTAMITPVVAGLTGSSWHAVSGPTTAISALVFAALNGAYSLGSPEFYGAAIVLALFVGVIQLFMGLLRLGALADFVSHSVMTGFVSAAALLIALSQLGGMLGLALPRTEEPARFIWDLGAGLGDVSWPAVTLAATAIAVAWLLRRFRASWPNYIIALAVASVVGVAMSLAGLDIATIGVIAGVVPSFSLPPLQSQHFTTLGSPAMAIALVGLLEASAISRAIAQRSGQELDANREFVGQGLSNLVGSFFRCYPGSASFTRSGVNYDAGAQTPMSAVFGAAALFMILLLITPLFAYVPRAAMAGVIFLVALRLLDLGEIRHLVSHSKGESVVAATTFLAGLVVSLEFAIYCGVILSILLFVERSATPGLRVGVPDPALPRRSFRPVSETGLPMCPQMIMSGLDGPLFFGSVPAIRREFREFERIYPTQHTMIFNIRGVGQIDLPAAELMIEEARRRKARGGQLFIQTKIPRAINQLKRFGVLGHLADKKVHLYKGDAIARAIPQLNRSICDHCTVRIFTDCPPAPSKLGFEEKTAGKDSSSPS